MAVPTCWPAYQTGRSTRRRPYSCRPRFDIDVGSVITKLDLLHFLLALAAGGSIYLAWREVRRRYISQWRLLLPPMLGLGVALGLALIEIAGVHQPAWTFATMLLLGLGAGGLRGWLMHIEHDLYRPVVAVSHRAKLVLVWVAVAVGAAVVVEIVAAHTAPALADLRFGAALVAMGGAAAMLGRAVAIAVQLNRHFADIHAGIVKAEATAVDLGRRSSPGGDDAKDARVYRLRC